MNDEDKNGLERDILHVLASEKDESLEFPLHQLDVVYTSASGDFATVVLHAMEFSYGRPVTYYRYLALARKTKRGEWVCARDQFLPSWAEPADIRTYPNLNEHLSKMDDEYWYKRAITLEIDYITQIAGRRSATV